MNEEKSQWQQDFEDFYEKHPNCPLSEDIESLNLIMKREYAEAIKKGTKTIEFRDFSKFYCDKLFDKDVDKYIAKHKDDPEVKEAMDKGIVTPLKMVNSLHFHNYNNSWTMDVECVENGVILLCEEDVKYLQDKYNCHALDDDLKLFEGKSDEERPMLFWFAVGEIQKCENI